jgi:peptidoglycan/xylan/chitin deacetylase (PgdA/CDA1 family)
MTVALTIDVEQEDKIKSYEEEGLFSWLDLLKECEVNATFFVTGKYAQMYPNGVKEIIKYNHEVANHSYSHARLFEISELGVIREIIGADEILTQLSGKKIFGFRAPYNSPTSVVYDCLKNLNYAYDSSIHPTYVPFRYDKRKYPIHPFCLNGFLEIPSSATPKYRFPIGWLWARNLGARYVKSCVNSIIKSGNNIVFYAHNWEFVELKRGFSWLKRRNTGEKFCGIMHNFISYLQDKNQRFITMIEMSKEAKDWRNQMWLL